MPWTRVGALRSCPARPPALTVGAAAGKGVSRRCCDGPRVLVWGRPRRAPERRCGTGVGGWGVGPVSRLVEPGGVSERLVWGAGAQGKGRVSQDQLLLFDHLYMSRGLA